MKTIDPTILDAFSNENGVDVVARLRVAPSLHFVDDADINKARSTLGSFFAPGVVDYTGGERVGFMGIPQDFISTADGHGITAYNAGGELQMSSTNNPGLLGIRYQSNQIYMNGAHTRPGLYYEDANPDVLYVIVSSSSNTIAVYTISVPLLLAGTAECVTAYANTNIAVKPGEAIHCVDYMMFVSLYVDDGGVRARLVWNYLGVWSIQSISPTRFMPKTMTLTVSDSYKLVCSGAVKSTEAGLKVYVYWTMPDTNSVYMMSVSKWYHSGLMTQIYSWSDAKEVIPSDLSMFYITKVCRDINPQNPSDARIRISGQFARTGEFNSDSVYNLVFWSEDGTNFSMDAFTIVSISRMPLMISPRMTNAMYSAFNCYATMVLSNPKNIDDVNPVIISESRIKRISGGPGMSWQLSVSNGDDAITKSIIDEQYQAYLDFGIKIGDVYEFTPYEKCVVSSATKVTKDGARLLSVGLSPEGMWRLSQVTYPFYMEINSKQSAIDALNERDNLYPAANCIGIQDSLVADFHGLSDTYGSASSPVAKAAGEIKHHWTGDFSTMLGLISNPTVKELPITFKIFGWSRIGLPYPEDDNTDPITNQNDTFQLLLDVVKGDGSGRKEILEIPTSYAVPCYPPQTWKPGSARVGAYPISYVIDSEASGLNIGDQIVKAGVRVTSPHRTVYAVERIESDGLILDYGTGISQPWDLVSEEIDTHISLYQKSANVSAQNKPWVIASTDGTSAYAELLVENIVPIACNGYSTVKIELSGFKDDLAESGTFRVFMSSATGAPNYSCSVVSSEWKPLSRTRTVILETTILGDRGGVLGAAQGYVKVNIERHPGDTVTNGGYIASVKEIWWNEVLPPDRPNDVPVHALIWSEELATKEWDENGNLVAPMSYRLKDFGVASVLFSEKPYAAFDFDTTAKFVCKGIGSIVGLVGLASDGRNYISAKYYSDSKLTIEQTIGGVARILASIVVAPETFADNIKMKLSHRGGNISVYLIDALDVSGSENTGWPTTPTLSYAWKQIDGPICADADIQHVGVFGMMETKRTRIVGFRLNETSNCIGVFRGAKSTTLADWPASGNIIIDGAKYSYASKTGAAPNVYGPFEVRANGNVANWVSDGQTYSGNYIDLCLFSWASNATYRTFFDNLILASDSGYSFKVDDVDWKVWMNQGGTTYYLKNRARLFSAQIPHDDFKVVRSDKAFITEGFIDITERDTEPLTHMTGAFCFLDNDNVVSVLKFTASNGGFDATVKDMLSVICRSAGVSPAFPGDRKSNSPVFITSQGRYI